MDKFLDNFAKIPQRQKLAGILVLVCLLLVGHYFLIYDDQSTQLDRLNAEAQKLEADLVEKQAIAENLDKYKVEVRRLEAELDRAKNLLPDESEVPALLAQISSLGGKVGLEISRFEPQKEEERDFYARLPFKVRLSGNYHEIAAFIDAVARLERIVNVENIGMKEPLMKNKKYVVNTDLIVTTYRFIDKSSKAASTGGK